jgi:hypothetical protein
MQKRLLVLWPNHTARRNVLDEPKGWRIPANRKGGVLRTQDKPEP